MSQHHLSPKQCAALSEELGRAIAKLRAWDVRILDFSRLEQERRLLANVAAVGAYPSDPDQLRTIAHALRDAHEFRYINHSMPESKLEGLTKDLQRAVGGTPNRRVGRREPYQFQTQFWIGAVLGFAGVTPIIPPAGSRKSPDYFVQNGTIYYGVEVKRPETPEGAERALRDAARQLGAAKTSGAIVIDISDCIATEATEIVQTASDSPSNLPCVEAFTRLANRLEEIAYDDERSRVRPDFLPATVLVVLASIFRWRLDDLDHPDLIKLCRFGAFFKVNRPTLAYHRALWLRNLLFEGMRATGHALTISREGIDQHHFVR